MSGADDRGGDTPDYDALERSIRSSRSRIDDTLDSLRHRIAHFSPRQLMEHTMSRNNHGRTYRGNDDSTEGTYDPEVHTSSGRSPMTSRHASSSSSMMGIVRDNPIPLALVGIGLGWLALSGSGYDRRIANSRAVRSVGHRASDAAHYARDTFYGATDSVRSAAGSAYESASDAIGSASETIRDQAGRLTEQAGRLTGSSDDDRHLGRDRSAGPSSIGRMQHAVTDAGGRLWDVVEDHPLVAGVVGVALGAALGAAIPSTRYENRWVGDYADEATERAKALAKDALDRGARVAQAAVQTAKDEVGEAAAAVTEAAREEAKKPA